MSWLRERVLATLRHGTSPDVLRQYARCYIMKMIGVALFLDKTNDIVSLRWVPLLRDFETCSKLSCGSTRFPSWCPPGRDLLIFPLVSRLNGLGQSSRDHHSRRMLHLRNKLNRIEFDYFIWTPYILPAWRAIEPDWVNEVSPCGLREEAVWQFHRQEDIPNGVDVMSSIERTFPRRLMCMISSWRGLSFRARVQGQELRHMHP
ncbi:hypothetical protein PIB30_051199 [Stylosanthes scabra]|uniref:Aminotransferase-like plant mobile domain-containing protein n=1 Tax=Stylosanthes scabra TaxID=79078 RepID=A0ABU6YJL6_9FABA|nr:hypothetical protein [Stylosanthes scabra]